MRMTTVTDSRPVRVRIAPSPTGYFHLGGARTALWMRIKASVYGIPILVPREAECSIVGCAAMAAAVS